MPKRKSSQRIKVISGIVLLLGVLLFLLMLPEIIQKQQQPVLFLISEPCDLKETSCTATKGNKSISLEITPGNIASLVPLTFLVTLKNIQAQSVVLDIKGKEMFMGINQIKLLPTSGENMWTGTTELAVCTTGMTTWTASILAYPDQSTEPEIATFEFESK